MNDHNEPLPYSGHLLSLVRKLCSTLIPADHDNFDKICRYSLDLISQKKVNIEDCEEQYILSKIRSSFMKDGRYTDSSYFEDLYQNLKKCPVTTVNSGDLVYCLFLLSNLNSSKQDASFFNVSNNVQKLKFTNRDINSSDLDLYTRQISERYGDIPMRKHVSNSVRPHTIHGEVNHDYAITSKYSLLARDLICVFQGLPGKHISFNTNEKFTFDVGRTDLFDGNDIFFAKRLSVLGQHFKSIKAYSNTTMNNSSKGFVCQSFGSALDEQINDFYKLLTNIQSNYHHRGHSDVTLHKLNIWTYETCLRFDALSNLIGKCRSKKGGALISVVYDFLHNGDPIVCESIRTILSKVVKPIRSMLNHWIFYGELKDEFKEFFICLNESSHITTSLSNEFWHDKFSINKAMLPGFISKEQAYKILITGKAISMLREVSSNKVAIILPLYDQLKQSFENSNLETLFDRTQHYNNSNDFASLLEFVYKEMSQTALNILSDRYTLKGHFRAHKRYLLFEQGDFMNYLMELLYPIINRPANKLKLYTLSQTLENAIRKTNAQHDSSEVLNRIDIFLEQSLQNQNGWNIFTLKYRIDGPISTIFNEQSQVIYSRIFMLFWKIKRMHFSLNQCWINLKLQLSNMRNLPPSLRSIFYHFNFTVYQILSFVNTIERYFNYVLESKWTLIQNELDHPRNLDKLIKGHQLFLQNVVKRLFFENSNNLTGQFSNISDHIFSFIDKLESFIVELDALPFSKTHRCWQETVELCESEIETDFNFWLIHFSKMFHKEIVFFLELLVETEEDDLQELCFSIDFNKYYKCNILTSSED